MTVPVWRSDVTDDAIRDELDGRHPERLKLRPSDVTGLREAFTVLDDLWTPTIARARRLSSGKVHERVNGEYSFVETFRHLLFAWDAWLSGTALPTRDGWHPWSLPPDDSFAADAPAPVLWAGGWTRCDAAPELDPVLDLRVERLVRVRGYLSEATSKDIHSPGSPPPWHGREASVLYCMRVVLHDEWWHHQFATRDLTVLEQ